MTKPNAFWHQLWDFSRLLGLRDRLRCPKCRAVGTWKPHGGWLDFEDERKVRRWVCKWCGLYAGPETETKVVLGPTCWVLKSGLPAGTTPYERLKKVNPWRG